MVTAESNEVVLNSLRLCCDPSACGRSNFDMEAQWRRESGMLERVSHLELHVVAGIGGH